MAREKETREERHPSRVSLARPFSRPTTSKRLLRRLVIRIPLILKTDSNYVVTQSAAIHIEDLAPLLVSPDVADRFFKYKGSLTTPGCYESVTWFVMNNHPQISELEVRVTRQQSE